MGLKETRQILIAIKAEPQIELRIINKITLLEKILFNRNYLLFLGSGIFTVSKDCMKSSLWPSHKYSA